MYADTNWHKLDVYIKLNSAPGANDGILAWWWDADPNTAPPTFTRTNIQWMSATSDTQRGWNTFGIGGNNYNSFSGATNGEQWYAIDDVVVSTTPIPNNYVIGGGGHTSRPAPPTGLKVR
jgi:hypothetical protein